MVRLKELAAAAGVSVMTVSRVMRDHPQVSAVTREKVRSLAAQMGYVPDISARGLRSRKTGLLGLLISAMTNPVNARVILAIEETAHELGYDLILAQTLNRTDREEAALRRMLARRVDGLFVAPVYRMEPEAKIYEELAKAGTPVVILGHRAPFCASFAAVETEDRGASEAVTKHLIEVGHKRIAFFSGPLTAPWARERFEGYQRAVREAGLPQDDALVFKAGSTIEEGAAAALRFAQENTGATALQAAHDLIAIGAANALMDQGLRVPEDLSVTGFGNIQTAEYFRTPLTTVRQPKLRLGAAAMELMQKLLNGQPPEVRRLPGGLVQRASVAAPRPGAGME
jgi:LacI family transcriptional regulator